MLLSSVAVVLAGQIDSPAGPTAAGGQMYTLEQIYDRLAGGGNATKMTTFTDPAGGPGTGTMHTLDEIYELAWPARVPKTGAGDLAGYPEVAGEDGHADMQKGVAWPSPRFTDNGDDTVTDNLTGLMWMENADAGNDCQGGDTGLQTWADALASAAACNAGAGFAGYTDWRLPNAQELQSLIDYGQSSPALPSGHPFDSVQSNYYWSSTTYASDTSKAWNVNLANGNVYNGGKTGANSVWPVRGGQ